MKLFLLTTVLALELTLLRKPVPAKVRAALRDADRAFAKAGAKLRHVRRAGHDGDHYCDHHGPDEEPCCGEKDRADQDACLQDKHGDGHYCDHHGPDEEPCCGEKDRADQDACLQDKHGDGGDGGHGHDIPTEAEVRRILRQEECTGLTGDDATMCEGLVNKIVDVCYPKCVGTMQPGPDGGDGGQGHYCDHHGPDEEPCCEAQDRAEQDACLKEKHGGGHYCDHHGPDEEPCCGEKDRADQDACLQDKGIGSLLQEEPKKEDPYTHGDGDKHAGKRGHYCDHHGPDEEPCCGEKDRADQDACLQDKHGDGGDGGCGPEQCFEHCAMDVLVESGVIDTETIPSHADIELDTLGFECGIFAYSDDLDAGVRTYLDENGDAVSDEQQLCGQAVSCGLAACHAECVHDGVSFHKSIDCFSCCIPFVFERPLEEICAERELPNDGGPIPANPGLVGDHALPDHCRDAGEAEEAHPCAEGGHSLLANATHAQKVQAFVATHRAQLAVAGRVLRGKHGERQWLIKRGAGAFRMHAQARDDGGDDDDDDGEGDEGAEVEYTQAEVQELVYQEQCVAEEVPDLDTCSEIVAQITDACYPKCTSADECGDAADVNDCASKCFEDCAHDHLREILGDTDEPDGKAKFADAIKDAECAKFDDQSQHESCRNVVDGIVNFCWDGSEPDSADFACSALDGRKMHKCFRKCSRAYMRRLSGAEQSFLAKAPLLRRDVELGAAFQ